MTFFAQEFLDMLGDKIQIAALLKRDSYGQPTYGPIRTYPGRINYETRNVLGKDNQIVQARGVAWLACVDPVGADDRIIFPDGTEPTILMVAAGSDENGPAYTKLYFQ